jgi:hypothetical protein
MSDGEQEDRPPTLPSGPYVISGDPGLPSVLIQTWSNATEYNVSGPVRVVLIDWSDLKPGFATRGSLCTAWKAVWGLPGHQRRLVLDGLIERVRQLFPIRATFTAEAYTPGGLLDIGDPVEFDATERVLKMSPDEVDNFRDDDYPTDHLADDLPRRRDHYGPFRVEVKWAALEFLNADENEEHERQRE